VRLAEDIQQRLRVAQRFDRLLFRGEEILDFDPAHELPRDVQRKLKAGVVACVAGELHQQVNAPVHIDESGHFLELAFTDAPVCFVEALDEIGDCVEVRGGFHQVETGSEGLDWDGDHAGFGFELDFLSGYVDDYWFLRQDVLVLFSVHELFVPFEEVGGDEEFIADGGKEGVKFGVGCGIEGG